MSQGPKRDRNQQARKYAHEVAKEVEEQECGNFEDVAEEGFKAGWNAAALAGAKPSSTMLTDLLSYVRSWAETTTEEECSTDGSMVVVDRNILRARKLLEKHEIEFADPSEDE